MPCLHIVANETNNSLLVLLHSGQAKADQTIVTAFMTAFAYFFGEMKMFLHVTDPATGERKLQVCCYN